MKNQIKNLIETLGIHSVLKGVLQIFQCKQCFIEKDGSIRIENPQKGHWLTDDEMRCVIEWFNKSQERSFKIYVKINNSRELSLISHGC